MTTYSTTPNHMLTTTTQTRVGSWIADDDRAELETAKARLANLETVMECGHQKRYLIYDERRGLYTACALCELARLTDAPRGAKLIGKKTKTRR